MSTLPGLARPRWPAPAPRQEDRTARTASDLQMLEERLNQRIATIASADRWALGLVLGRALGRLVARVATPGDGDSMKLEQALLLTVYNVTAMAQITTDKRRGTLRKVSP